MTTTKTNLVRLTDDDLQNLVAFGNRGTMTGREADTWVDLKGRLLAALHKKDGKDETKAASGE